MIVNKTTVCELNIKLPLTIIKDLLPCSYNPRKIQCLFFKYANTTMEIWASGKIIILGNKIKSVIKRFLSLIKPHFKNVEILSLKTKNVVFSSKTSRVNLYDIKQKFVASYEPELFPGLSLKYRGATIVIFSSGKFYITGVVSGHKTIARSFKAKIEKGGWIPSQ